MRGLEALVGSLLVASGMIGPMVATGPGPLVGGDLEGEVHAEDIHYLGNASVVAEDAVFRSQGPVASNITVSGASLTVYEYRKTGGFVVAAGYKIEAAYKLDKTTSRHYYRNATIEIAGSPGGFLYARTNATLGSATFDLSLHREGPTDIVASPKTEEMTADDTRYSTLLPSPVFGLGHHDARWHDILLTNESFQRLHAEGALDVIVENATLTVRHNGGTDRYELSNGGGGDGSPPEPGKEIEYAAITSSDANLEMGFGDVSATLLTHEPTWKVNGTAALDVIEGNMSGEGQDKVLVNDTVSLVGNTTIELEATGQEDGENLTGTWSLPSRTLSEPDLHGEFESDARKASINGDPLRLPPDPAVPEEATLLGKILGLLLLAWTVGKKVIPFGVALLSKDPLEHPRRQSIHRTLQRRGVANVRQIQRATSIPLGSLSYHLRVLEEMGLVESIEHANYRAYFVSSENLSLETKEKLALLADETRREIAETLLAAQGVCQQALADGLGLSQGAVSKQLSKLVDAGLVDKRGERNIEYAPSGLLERWLGPRTSQGR